MRLLLDTHTFLWFVADNPNLTQAAKALIEDPENERWISVEDFVVVGADAAFDAYGVVRRW
jgi:PIN domain nuclease of toxin-antitoxin system